MQITVWVIIKSIIFILGTIGLAWVSRAPLRHPQHHGFYRFFSWEAILILFVLNVDDWFVDPFSFWQIVSWVLLLISLFLVVQGVQLFRKAGKQDQARAGSDLYTFEKTTQLVTSGLYRYIRHPFYSSLLFLGWGIYLKDITWIGTILVVMTTVLLVVTARIEEGENLQYFGEAYRAYMQKTRMFVPYIF